MTSCLPLIVAMTTLVTVNNFVGANQVCRFNFSYANGRRGVFSSPGFPNPYPSMLRCTYFFDASKNGGVHIKFDHFDIDTAKKGQNVYDYLDVFTVGKTGFRTVLNRFCGDKIPEDIVSPQSKLELNFVTDHWQNFAKGFKGHFEFLGNDWVPFDHKPLSCGSKDTTGLTGHIQSPKYPGAYLPNVNCSWVINVPANKLILVRILHLDIDAGYYTDECTDSMLLLYNGYASPSSISTKEWCGHGSSYESEELQYVTTTNRTVVRFIAGPSNMVGRNGFRLMWMAVSIPTYYESCDEFLCEGNSHCENKEHCPQSTRYCIPRSLVCDGIQHCGLQDDSDERKCTREILIMAACIAVPSLLLIMLIVLVVYCYKNKQVQKSASQDQPLATSQSQNTTSRDSFTSNHRQMIVHTSFIDGAASATPLDPDTDHDPYDIDNQTTRGLFSEGSGSLRTHKKRPSYHMMQQNYEDGNLIIAQI